MSGDSKDNLRKLARRILADPTRGADKDKLARGVLMLLGERP